MILQYKEKLTTKSTFTDITRTVNKNLRASKLKNGIVVVFSRHTTGLVRVLEKESLLMEDMENFLERNVPSSVLYKHDDLDRRKDIAPDERQNGYSHLRALFFNHSETIPFSGYKLNIGRWQSIFFVECDHFREREYLVTIIGEK